MTREELEQYAALRVAQDVIAQELQTVETECCKFHFKHERERLLLKRDALALELIRKEEALIDRIFAIEKAIDGLELTEQTILRMIYILGMTEEATAEELACNVRTVQRFKQRAIEKLEIREKNL